MGTKSRETIYGASVRAAAERAAEARKDADRFAVEGVCLSPVIARSEATNQSTGPLAALWIASLRSQ